MKRLLVLVLVLVPLTAFSADQVKLGFVDLQRALNESERGKKAKAELEGVISKKQVTIDEKVKAREKLREELQRQTAVLSEAALRKKQDELSRVEREVDRLIEDSNAELQKLQKEKELAILRDLEGILNTIGAEGGYTVIFPSDVILYSSDEAELTDVLIKKYDEAGGEEAGKEAPKK